MFFTSLLNTAVLSDEVYDGSVVIVPAEEGTWHPANLLVTRDAWDSLFVQFRSKEPEVEQVMHAIMGSGNVNDKVIEFLGGLSAVRNRYMELAHPLEEPEEPAGAGVDEGVTPCEVPPETGTIEATDYLVSAGSDAADAGVAETDASSEISEKEFQPEPASAEAEASVAGGDAEDYAGPTIPDGFFNGASGFQFGVVSEPNDLHVEGTPDCGEEEYDPLAGREDILMQVANKPAAPVFVSAPPVDSVMSFDPADEDDLFGDDMTGASFSKTEEAADTHEAIGEEPDLADILAQLPATQKPGTAIDSLSDLLQEAHGTSDSESFTETNMCTCALEGTPIPEVVPSEYSECTSAFREVYSAYEGVLSKHSLHRVCFMNGTQVSELRDTLNAKRAEDVGELFDDDFETAQAFLRTINKCYWNAAMHISDGAEETASEILSALADLIFTR